MTSLELERSRAAVREARAFVHERCAAAQVAEDTCDTAVLLVSELVTNAVEHARSPVRLTVQVSGGTLHVEVQDTNRSLPAIQHASPGAVHGRGMAIVDTLATDWGVRATARGKVVWFDLALG